MARSNASGALAKPLFTLSPSIHQGRLIAGTGNKGKIYAIEGNGEFVDLLKASANQVTGFAAAPNGGIYTACSNLGKLFLMEDSSQREGTFDSDVFDAKIFSRWGRMAISRHRLGRSLCAQRQRR